MSSVRCAKCGREYAWGQQWAGKMVTCQACGEAFMFPPNDPATSPPVQNYSLPPIPALQPIVNRPSIPPQKPVPPQSAYGQSYGGGASAGGPRRSDEIDYQLFGEEMQYAEVTLDPGEMVIAEAGAMMYMTAGIKMETVFGDPSQKDGSFWGKLLTAGQRVFTGESLFMTTFTNISSQREIVAFASPYPGHILPMHLDQLGGQLICQKASFLCGARGVQISIHFQRKILAGLFGGEGFIMQKLTGDGIVLVHAGGAMMQRDLAAGETLRLDTGCLVALTPTVHYDVQTVGGFKNTLFGGEGLFLATVTGPGRVWLQSLPFSRLAGRVLANAGSRGNKDEGSMLGGLGNMFMSGMDQ